MQIIFILNLLKKNCPHLLCYIMEKLKTFVKLLKEKTFFQIFLSAGMKASIFDLHVKLGELELAEIALADLNKSSPNFTLDEFKVIDFATLMVYRKKITKAFESISEEAKKRFVVIIIILNK